MAKFPSASHEIFIFGANFSSGGALGAGERVGEGKKGQLIFIYLFIFSLSGSDRE